MPNGRIDASYRVGIPALALAAWIAAAAAFAQTAEPLDGYWLSDGYGYLAEIRGGRIALFEITPFSCIASETLTEETDPPDPRGRRFVTKDRSTLLFLDPGPSADSEWFGDPSAASRMPFRRAAARPEACGRKTPNDPLTNFEIFAWTFGAHHGFLEHRGVDWAALTAASRAKVNA